MTDRELLQQALDYIKETYDFCVVMQQPKEREEQLMKALEAALAQPEQSYQESMYKQIAVVPTKKTLLPTQPEQEPVAHAVIAGVLFDFMGWLTSRPKRLVLSASDEASPAVKVIEEFAKMRGLSLDDAKVKDWQDMTAPPKREWVGLTDDERNRYISYTAENFAAGVLWAETKLRERNT